MFETIISGIILAFVSGVSFFAYKHPIGYRTLVVRLISPVSVGLWLGGLLVSLLDIRMNAGALVAIAEEYPNSTLTSHTQRLTAILDYSTLGLWGIGIFLASAAYLLFLWFLPLLTRAKSSDA